MINIIEIDFKCKNLKNMTKNSNIVSHMIKFNYSYTKNIIKIYKNCMNSKQ